MSEDVTEKIRSLTCAIDAKKSISTAQMAQQIGMERKKLKRILGGREVMSVDILLQISEKLDLKPEDLSGIEEMSASKSNTIHKKNRKQDYKILPRLVVRKNYGNRIKHVLSLKSVLNKTLFYLSSTY